MSRYINKNTTDDPLRDAEQYNDIDAPIDENAYATLTANGVDDMLVNSCSLCMHGRTVVTVSVDALITPCRQTDSQDI